MASHPTSRAMSIRMQLFAAFGAILLLVLAFGAFTYQAVTNVASTAVRIADMTAKGGDSAKEGVVMAQHLAATVASVDSTVIVFLLGVLVAAFGLAALLSWTVPNTLLEPIRKAAAQLTGTAGVLSSSTQQASAAA